jgi:hypothetical protein
MMNEFKTNNAATPIQDPKTGVLGKHPLGAGVGAVGGGAAAGAAGGVIAGPVGALAGAAAGAVVGGLAGAAAAEAVNPITEAKFWQDGHPSGPYATAAFGYEEYAPAYRYGWESFGRRGVGQTFENAEAELGRGWDKAKGGSRLMWDQAKSATRNAWDRVEVAARGAVATVKN